MDMRIKDLTVDTTYVANMVYNQLKQDDIIDIIETTKQDDSLDINELVYCLKNKEYIFAGGELSDSECFRDQINYGYTDELLDKLYPQIIALRKDDNFFYDYCDIREKIAGEVGTKMAARYTQTLIDILTKK